MQALDREAEVETRYGGRFVQSIDGVAGRRRAGATGSTSSTATSPTAARPTTGCATATSPGGTTAPGATTPRRRSSLGAFPEPFLHGYDGRRRPAVVVSSGCPGRARSRGALHARLLPARHERSRPTRTCSSSTRARLGSRCAARSPGSRRAPLVPRRPADAPPALAVPLPLRGRAGEPGPAAALLAAAGRRRAARRASPVGRGDRAVLLVVCLRASRGAALALPRRRARLRARRSSCSPRSWSTVGGTSSGQGRSCRCSGRST